jgi:hypothetical protein
VPYITHPTLNDEQVQGNAARQVELKLKTPWRDGATHLLMSSMECMQQLAARMPRFRLQRPMTVRRTLASAGSAGPADAQALSL